VGAGSGVNLLISYGFGFEIPHGERAFGIDADDLPQL
jgi:hypothetical protein